MSLDSINRILVLVKPSLDIFSITEKNWDKEKGVLKRDTLDAILNPLDGQALEMALRIRKEIKKHIEIHTITMGVPQAEEILRRYCLALGADKSFLLTDRKFAGADTIATSRALSAGIAKLENESGPFDLILGGVEAIDGDTAQVTRQAAALLDREIVPYVKNISFIDKQIVFDNMTETGMQKVIPELPCIASVLEWTLTKKPALGCTRWAYTDKNNFVICSAIDVNAKDEEIGGKGSHTQVIEVIQLKPQRNVQCAYMNDTKELVERVKAHFKRIQKEEQAVKKQDYVLSEGQKPYFGNRDVWVYAEYTDEGVAHVTLELLSKARELADIFGTKAGAVLAGDGSRFDEHSRNLFAYGADIVYQVKHPFLKEKLSLPLSKAIVQLVKSRYGQTRPQIFIGGATKEGRLILPRISILIGAGQTADCTGLSIMNQTNKKGVVLRNAIMGQRRTALGGNIGAVIVTTNCDPETGTQMATVRPGVFQATTPDFTRKGEIVEFTPEVEKKDLRMKVVGYESFAKTCPNLQNARVIVAGGRAADFSQIKELAAAIKNKWQVPVEIGASRAAIEVSHGKLSRDIQIGQTGVSVSPDLYIACCISGAVQHVVGIQRSKIIVAVNTDASAPIFQTADYGIIGNAEEIMPRLIESFQ